MQILIVDDYPPGLHLLRLQLETHLFVVTTARTVEEALACAVKAPFDLFILDHRLGDVSGMQLREALRVDFPGTRALIFTAMHFPPEEQRAIREAGDDYLLKPVNAETLTAAVNHLLQLKSQHTARLRPGHRQIS